MRTGPKRKTAKRTSPGGDTAIVESATGRTLCARIMGRATDPNAPATESLARLAIGLCAARNGWCAQCACACDCPGRSLGRVGAARPEGVGATGPSAAIAAE